MCCEASWAHTGLLFLWRFCDAHKALVLEQRTWCSPLRLESSHFPLELYWVIAQVLPPSEQQSEEAGKRRKTSPFSSMPELGSEIWAAPEEKAGCSVRMRDLKTGMTTVTQYHNQREPVRTLSWPESRSEKKRKLDKGRVRWKGGRNCSGSGSGKVRGSAVQVQFLRIVLLKVLMAKINIVH